MPRRRLYSTNAERQAAYRARLAVRHNIATGPNARVAELEATLIAMATRAESAEARAVEAERRAATAMERARTLQISLAGLQHRLDQGVVAARPAMNRAERRRAEREARRHQ